MTAIRKLRLLGSRGLKPIKTDKTHGDMGAKMEQTIFPVSNSQILHLFILPFPTDEKEGERYKGSGPNYF